MHTQQNKQQDAANRHTNTNKHVLTNTHEQTLTTHSEHTITELQ